MKTRRPSHDRRLFGFRRAGLVPGLLVALVVAGAPTRALGQPGLPDGITQNSSGTFTEDEKNRMKGYFEENVKGLTGTSTQIRASRKALLQPLAGKPASPSFRGEWAGVVMPGVETLIKSENDETAINAVLIIGELGMPRSIVTLGPILADEKRAAVRAAAAFGFERVFLTAQNSTGPAVITPRNTTAAFSSLTNAIKQDKQPEVVDAAVLAMEAAIRVESTRVPGVGADAARQLSAAIEVRAKDAQAAELLPAFGRGAAALLSGVNNGNAALKLPESAVKEAGGTSGDLFALALRMVDAGGPNLEGDKLEQLCTLVRQAENLYIFSKGALGGPAAKKQDLDQALCQTGGPAVDKFRRGVLELIGADGELHKKPFEFPPNRFK